MKDSKSSRRAFIKNTTCLGVGCCIIPLIAKSEISGNYFSKKYTDDINLSDYTYCGFQCKDECKLYRATTGNNIELKKEAYKDWNMKERYEIDFDPEQVFCYKCKSSDNPMGIVLKNCSVRACALEKKHSVCIECKELITCEKELWKRFPQFKESMIEMQKKYFNDKTE